MTYPIIAFLILSIAAQIATWRKERIVDGRTNEKVSAIRLALVLQLAATVLGAYNFIASDLESKRSKSAQLAFEASAAGAKHLPSIMGTYFGCLRRGHNELLSFARFEQAIASAPAVLRLSLESSETAKSARTRQQALLACFSTLQNEAAVVLTEAITFGDRYPQELVQWAQTTVGLKSDQLVELTADGQLAQNYVALMSEGVFHALASAYLQNHERAK